MASCPIPTFYRLGPKRVERVAHSATTQGALRAAIIRLFNGDYRSATILDEAGQAIKLVERFGTITIRTSHARRSRP